MGRLKHVAFCGTFSILLAVLSAGCRSIPNQHSENVLPKASPTTERKPTPTISSMPTQTEGAGTVAPVCLDTKGAFIESSYQGIVYMQEMPYLAYLPPCYAEGSQSYPVAFLLHGFPYDQSHWIDLGLISTYEQGLSNEGWPHVIFIFPFVPDALFTGTDGGVGSYEQEFLDGLLPAIASSYRSLPSPEWLLLGGVSRGGVWALEIGLRNAGVIDNIAAISPALVYNQPRPRFDPFEIILDERIFPGNIFVSAAENETPFREVIEAFVKAMEREGMEHTFLLHPGNHNDETWRGMMEEFLAQILPALDPTGS